LFLLGYIFTENKIFQRLLFILGQLSRVNGIVCTPEQGLILTTASIKLKKKKRKNPHITGIFVSDKTFVAVVYGGTF